MSKQTFLTDVYRLVAGSFSEQNTVDHEGKPIAPEKYNWWAGLAIPKTPGILDWKQEVGNPTLMAILKAGQEAFPNGEWQSPNFSWKIKDGDSLNKHGEQHYPGHWIVGFSRNQQIGPVPCYNQSCAPIQPMETKKGWSYKISGSSVGNGRTGNQAGVYVNMEMVQLCIANPEDIIVTGPSAQQVFGAYGGAQVTQPQALTLTPMGQGMAQTVEALKAMMPSMTDAQLIQAGFVTASAAQAPVLVLSEAGKNAFGTLEALKATGMTEEAMIASGMAIKTNPAPGFLAGNGQY